MKIFSFYWGHILLLSMRIIKRIEHSMTAHIPGGKKKNKGQKVEHDSSSRKRKQTKLSSTKGQHVQPGTTGCFLVLGFFFS